MLSNITLSNFKCYTKADLELAKLNVFIGSNSSGKSSIIQALMLIKTMWEQKVHPQTALQKLNLGTVQDVLFMRGLKGSIKIGSYFNLDDRERNQIVEVAAQDTVFNDLDFSKIGYSLQLSEDNVEIEIECGNSVLLGIGNRRPAWGVKEVISGINIDLNYPYPKFMGGSSSHIKPLKVIDDTFRERFTNRLHHLGPRRGNLLLGSPIPNRRPEFVDSSGENVEGILGFMQGDPYEEPIYKKIAHWASEFGFKELSERTIDGPMWVSSGRDSDLDLNVSRVNIGFGINQLLPIIVLCFDSRPLSTVVIEQPEIHLHPESQAKLADLFLDVVEYGNQLVLETHSEHLLMRLQRYVAEGRLAQKDLAVFFVQKTRSGSKIRKLKVESDGRIPEGLPGFFEADFDELLALLKARGES